MIASKTRSPCSLNSWLISCDTGIPFPFISLNSLLILRHLLQIFLGPSKCVIGSSFPHFVQTREFSLALKISLKIALTVFPLPPVRARSFCSSLPSTIIFSALRIVSLDTPASLESSSSVWIGSAFSEICKSWGLIPPVDVACFSFAFAWTLQPAWKVRHRCEFGLYQISVKVHFYTGYHEIQLASLSPLLGSRFSFLMPIRNMPYFSLQGQFRRFYPFGIVVSL